MSTSNPSHPELVGPQGQGPDFFVVGAPKCGTTSIYEYLRNHPQIFLPRIKEPNHFATDLEIKSYPEIDSLERYLDLFAAAAGASARGDASQFHLYSRVAARNIQRFNPGAKIVVLLREPISLMRSLHAQYLSTGDEEVSGFEAAVALEDDRLAGRRVPRSTLFPRCMAYLDVATLSVQVERYLEHFERSAIRIVLLDDLRRDARGVYRDLLRFLGVTAAFEPELAPHNVGRGLDPIDPELSRRLAERFAPEVERLERLIDRDLSAWKQPLS